MKMFFDFDELLDPSKPVVLKDRQGKEYKVLAWVPARSSTVIMQNLDEIKEFIKTKKIDDRLYELLRDICVVAASKQYPIMDAEWFDDNVDFFQFASFAGKIVWQALDFFAPALKEAMKTEAQKVSEKQSLEVSDSEG